MSPCLILKFGGTSVADVAMMRTAAELVRLTKKECNDIVVVVSAMGEQTDELFDLVHAATAHPSPRELDVIASTGELVSSSLFATILTDMGLPARSLSGFQAGIRTTGRHGNARIESIDTRYLRKLLANGEIPVVAGFQGHNEDGEVTTLGRGGSDTTAAALGAELHARECRIYTDVPGIFTADPRICAKAQTLETVHFEEILELAALGVKVLHPRAVEFAGRNRLQLRILSTMDRSHPGTRIVFELEENMEQPNVTGIAYNLEEAKITVRGLPDHPGIAATLFSRIAEQEIDVDVIVQNIAANNLADISFTIHRSQLERALECTKKITKELGSSSKVESTENIAKVSLVGLGMRGHAGIAAQMFSALADAKINIQMIATSEIKISAIIDEEKAELAVRRLHKRFGLDAKAEVGVVKPVMAKA